MGGEGNLKALAGAAGTRTKDHGVVKPHHKAIAMGAEQGGFAWRKGESPAEGSRARPYRGRAGSPCPGSRSGLRLNALRSRASVPQSSPNKHLSPPAPAF